MGIKSFFKSFSPRNLFERHFYLISLLDWNSLDFRRPSLSTACALHSFILLFSVEIIAIKIGKYCNIKLFSIIDIETNFNMWLTFTLWPIVFWIYYSYFKRRNMGLKILVKFRAIYRHKSFKCLSLHFIICFVSLVLIPCFISSITDMILATL